MNSYIKKKIIKYQGTSTEEIGDAIAVEKKLVISVQGKDILSIYCTPMMIKELITGLLLTEGIITNKISPSVMNIDYGDEITVNLQFDVNNAPDRLSTSRCLGGFTVLKKRDFEKINDNFSLTTKNLKNLFDDFQQKSALFRITGGFHSAAISDGKTILSFSEDIGRHNAVDKVIGDALLKDIPFTRKAMLVSCRISSEIISKSSRWGIPILASRSAPTDLAVEIAEMSGVTLIGFVREERMNIYTNQQRIRP
jgi:FdhD protein